MGRKRADLEESIIRERDLAARQRGALGLEPLSPQLPNPKPNPKPKPPERTQEKPSSQPVKQGPKRSPHQQLPGKGSRGIHVRLSDKLWAKLWAHCQTSGVSVSEVVRTAILFYLDTVQARDRWSD